MLIVCLFNIFFNTKKTTYLRFHLTNMCCCIAHKMVVTKICTESTYDAYSRVWCGIIGRIYCHAICDLIRKNVMPHSHNRLQKNRRDITGVIINGCVIYGISSSRNKPVSASQWLRSIAMQMAGLISSGCAA